MKLFLAPVLVILLSGLVAAMSVEEIGRLSELKTGDELMLQLIEKAGIDKPLTTSDVIYLREHGTSERVIQYLLKLSETPESAEQPALQEESKQISENLRVYTTTTKSGKKIQVVTNLDERGQRMGDPVPPPPPPEEVAPYEPPPPQEVRVTVMDERRNRDESEYDEGYAHEQQGIPVSYGGGYIGYPWVSYPYILFPHGMRGRQSQPPMPAVRINPSRPLVRPGARSRPAQGPAPRAVSLGIRR